MSIFCLKVLIFLLGHEIFQVALAVNCGVNWIPYGDEKCIQLTNDFVTHDDASSFCLNQIGASPVIPPLLTIKSEEEQNFLTKLIFEDSLIVDNVWLGGKRSNVTGDFYWDDEPTSSIIFANWHEGSPSDIPGNDCIQMLPRGVVQVAGSNFDTEISSSMLPTEQEAGLWTDTSCGRRNLAVCQKLPTWTLLELQNAVLVSRKEIREMLPIGFVYVQLPEQADAETNWPKFEWEDVTANYSGLFFRAEGGESLSFGEIQEDKTRQLVQANHMDTPNCGDNVFMIPERGASDYIRTSHYLNTSVNIHSCLQFVTSDTEVRPLNTAVRIWRRVA